MPDRPVTVVYAWDDTLVGAGRFGEPGEWLEGAQDALRGLLAAGYAVTVLPPQSWWELALETDEIVAKLHEVGVETRLVGPSDETPAGVLGLWTAMGTPTAAAHVDARAVEFTGDHEAVLEVLKERLPRP